MKNKAIISLLAVLIIVLGFLAFLMSDKKMMTNKNYEREITKVETTSESDDIDQIENDLNNTDLDSLDQEIVDIEAELN